MINQLAVNKETLASSLSNTTPEAFTWKQKPYKWCLLEILCHLLDEEREDFRTRIQYIFDTPDKAPPGINPPAWVADRNYMDQKYDDVLNGFLKERESSINWLNNLTSPDWLATCQSPQFSDRSAKFYLTNWVAHDLLHIKQITRLRYDYLNHTTGISLDYAGNWV